MGQYYFISLCLLTVYKDNIGLPCVIPTIVVVGELDISADVFRTDFEHLLADVEATVGKIHEMREWAGGVLVTCLIC